MAQLRHLEFLEVSIGGSRTRSDIRHNFWLFFAELLPFIHSVVFVDGYEHVELRDGRVREEVPSGDAGREHSFMQKQD